MTISLTKEEKREVFDLLAQDTYYEKQAIQDWFFNHKLAFYNQTFEEVCKDWGLSFVEGLKCDDKHFEKDFTQSLLTNSGCLALFSSKDEKQLEIAKKSLDFIEGIVESGCSNDNLIEIFIRYGDQLESCIEHLKSVVINYREEHNKGDK